MRLSTSHRKPGQACYHRHVLRSPSPRRTPKATSVQVATALDVHTCMWLPLVRRSASTGSKNFTFGTSFQGPGLQNKAKCREGRYGSPPSDDSPRSTGLPVSETQAGKPNSRTSSASTCSVETNILCIPPQDKHTDSADKQRQDCNMALRPSIRLHVPAQCIHACDHVLVFPTVSLHRRCCYLPPTASVSTRAVSLGMQTKQPDKLGKHMLQRDEHTMQTATRQTCRLSRQAATRS